MVEFLEGCFRADSGQDRKKVVTETQTDRQMDRQTDDLSVPAPPPPIPLAFKTILHFVHHVKYIGQLIHY